MSNLIKSSHVIPLDQLKVLEALKRAASAKPPAEPETLRQELVPDAAAAALRDQILKDAETVANERIAEANRVGEQLMADARRQIAAWWEEKRAEDEAAAEAARQAGYELGYGEGAAQAEAELRGDWEQRIAEAAAMLETAYAMKEQIVQEAEPFLVDLSCSIAGKVIGQKFDDMPELATGLIIKALSRRREQGAITLCVAPSQLAFVQAAREELLAAIDSQAELQIIPDAKVGDRGCVIRSAFGSVDARIDTQLAEIKRELLQLAHRSGQET